MSEINGKQWIGKSVNIQCIEKMGIFQGEIKELWSNKIKIIKVFRNGLPVRKLDSEVTISLYDIISINFIPPKLPTIIDKNEVMRQNSVPGTCITNSSNNENDKNNNSINGKDRESALSNQIKIMKLKKSKSPQHQHQHKVKQSIDTLTTNNSIIKTIPSTETVNNTINIIPTNMMPSKVEMRLASSAPHNTITFRNYSNPIDIKPLFTKTNSSVRNGHNNTNSVLSAGGGGGTTTNNSNSSNNPGVPITPIKIDRKKNINKLNLININNQTFGTPMNNSMDEDFDFEKNLALFDKQAIWEEIDATEKPDVVPNGVPKTYRHDEMVIKVKSPGLRQIKINGQQENVQEFTTDDGVIIPTIPLNMRRRVQTLAETSGYARERQGDMLGRGATDTALLLLGGARRFTTKNRHQWPKVTIICDEPYYDKQSEIGIITGRQLACHGINTCIFLNTECNDFNSTKYSSKELDLLRATDSKCTNIINELPSSDLVILTVRSNILDPEIIKWINENRSPVMAIDPPIVGVKNVTIKCSILPILPLDGIGKMCGNLYLCNVGIPDKFFQDAGIKYKSPYGHKYVIPLHFKE